MRDNSMLFFGNSIFQFSKEHIGILRTTPALHDTLGFISQVKKSQTLDDIKPTSFKTSVCLLGNTAGILLLKTQPLGKYVGENILMVILFHETPS